MDLDQSRDVCICGGLRRDHTDPNAEHQFTMDEALQLSRLQEHCYREDLQRIQDAADEAKSQARLDIDHQARLLRERCVDEESILRSRWYPQPQPRAYTSKDFVDGLQQPEPEPDSSYQPLQSNPRKLTKDIGAPATPTPIPTPDHERIAAIVLLVLVVVGAASVVAAFLWSLSH